VAPLTGSSTAEIDAPLEQVWEVVGDVESAPDWQGGLKDIHGLERDADGLAVVCETESDAKVRTIKTTVRFEYEPPARLSWVQQKGELKSLVGSWQLEDLNGDRTRVTYAIEADLGRMLGLVIRGPLVDLVREMLAGARANELKQRIESG
jgi:carbon monoxide dehydrogenase subunit G